MFHFNLICLTVFAAMLSSCDKGEYNYKDLNCSKAQVCQTKNNKPVTGLVSAYYSDGNPERTVSYVKGLREGVMTYYYESGTVRATVFYKNNLVDGAVKSYYENGILAGDCTYKANKLDGICKVYNEDGSILAEEQFKNGLKEGESIGYDKDVAVLKSHFKNNILTGRAVYDENSVLQAELLADDSGVFNRYQSYYPNGTLKIDAEMSGNKIVGKVTEYYDNGRIKSKYQINNGSLLGEYVTYRKNGNISYTETYTAGEELEGEKKVQAAIVKMKIRFMSDIIADILKAD